MAYVGRGAKGTVYTGKLNLPPSFLTIGTYSGLTANGVLLANGDSAFTALTPGTSGQLLIGATGSAPAFGTITSSGGTVTFTPGPNSLNMEAGASVPTTFATNSGNAIPALNILTVVGLSGSKTSGSGSTITVKSPPYADAGGSATSTLNSGSFVTGAFTLTLPVSAGLADGDLFEYVCTSAAAYVIQAVGAQKIRIGNALSSAAGTATSSGLAGDALTLRFRAADGFFYATSVIGVWITA